MKFVIVLAVLLVGVWLWRRARLQRDEDDSPAPPPPDTAPPNPLTPAAMVVCDQCGVHLPASDAVQGAHGRYCGAEHRRLAEGDAPR